MRAHLTVLFAAALLAAPAFGGELVLKDGSRVSGDLQELKEGKILFKTPHGALSVPLEAVASFAMTEPRMVTVGTGPARSAALVVDDKGTFEWNGERLPLSALVSILPPPEPVVRLSEPERWSGDVGFSVTWTDGNTHTLATHAEVNLKRDQSQKEEGFKNLLALGWKYDYARSGKEQIKRAGRAEGKWDLFLTTRVGAYVEGSWGYNYEAGVERKNTLGAGLTWKAADEEGFKLTLSLGASYLATFYNDKTLAAAVAAGTPAVPFEEYPAGRAELVVEWHLPFDVDLVHKTVAYQSLKNQDKHNVESETAFSRKIGGGWFFKLSAVYSWEEPPAPGKIRWDATYVFSVVFKF